MDTRERKAEENARKRFPRLPAGFGTIRYLGKGRRNAYAVHPPTRSGGQDGPARRERAICYVRDWYTGMAVLAAWHAGTYEPGMEARVCPRRPSSPGAAEALDDFCARLLSDFRRMGARSAAEKALPAGEPQWTVRQVYDRFYEWKFGTYAARRLSAATEDNTRRVFKKLAAIEGRVMNQLTIEELQRVVNQAGSGRTIVSKTLVLIRQLYRFSVPRGMCARNQGEYLVMPDTREPVHHQDFTDAELRLLWQHREDAVVRMILIMCYSGYRFSAYETLETDAQAGFFQGGVKTAAGKNRIVPIHSAIAPLVCRALAQEGYYAGKSKNRFRQMMKKKLAELGIDGGGRHHTPHSCRHTFSRLCESYGVSEADRKRMLGHSFGGDITNGVYGHRTLSELRAEIEKIRIPEG